jgi:CRISPR-associated protein Cas6
MVLSPFVPADPSNQVRPQVPLSPVVDFAFAIVGGATLDVDHGQALLFALRRACPGLERIPGLGVHAVRGTLGSRPGELLLGPASEVRLRLPAGSAPLLQDLAGQELEVAGHGICLGEGRPHPLVPVSALWARTVTIHFAALGTKAAQEQLEARFRQEFPWGALRLLRPRTIRVEGRQLLGFEAAVRGLSPQASLLLQYRGFGGRRSFGCGLFVPFAATSRSGSKAG